MPAIACLRLEAPLDRFVEVAGDRSEVVAVQPEVQLVLLTQMVEQIADLLLQGRVVECGRVDVLERLVGGTQSGADLGLPSLGDVQRRPVADRDRGLLGAPPELGMEARHELEER